MPTGTSTSARNMAMTSRLAFLQGRLLRPLPAPAMRATARVEFVHPRARMSTQPSAEQSENSQISEELENTKPLNQEPEDLKSSSEKPGIPSPSKQPKNKPPAHSKLPGKKPFVLGGKPLLWDGNHNPFSKKPSTEPMKISKEEQARRHALWAEMNQISEKQNVPWLDFVNRHIGPRDEDIAEMLKVLGPGAETMDSFVREVIPDNVMLPPKRRINTRKFTEQQIITEYERLQSCVSLFKPKLWMMGGGYYPVSTPPVIKRNLFENPGWYTSYTPYQPEISQGRLESLLNFQTMVSDLTGLPVANASLLDEGTAGAEAMTMSLNFLPSARAQREGRTYVVSQLVHKATIMVMKTRANSLGIRILTVDLSAPEAFKEIQDLGEDLVGVLAQYPDLQGGVEDFRELAKLAHVQGVLFSVATDLSALTVLTPPGEWGADIAFGNSQRFGVPMGYGGPHAAFMAVQDSIKRRLPGRIVGVSKDRTGRPALRLALQTREQNIRREKATSNVCTAQALLANMAAMYAVYHGPKQLKEMAVRLIRHARMVQAAAQHYGLSVVTKTLDPQGRVLSDTVCVDITNKDSRMRSLNQLRSHGIESGVIYSTSLLVFALSEGFDKDNLLQFCDAFQKIAAQNQEDGYFETAAKIWREGLEQSSDDIVGEMPDVVRRQSKYLTQPVFNTYHSETEMLRYMHHLQSKDLSLVHSMIPLGSCTMKLNGTAQMELISNRFAAQTHPMCNLRGVPGYTRLFTVLGQQLCAITGMHATSLQPNSGAQGEFAGLRAIRKYLEAQEPDVKRDICLIPVSAHGTNPASATMAGMRVVPIKCNSQTGNLDLEDLKAKCEQHGPRLGAIMVTYPSTFGVFEPNIREVCDIVHAHGGLVYMDGANMNAQIGLTSPGALGADVCHLNLHKTFCIPHGGGGPGVGPICVKKHLKDYIPSFKSSERVSSAPFGSASLLAISWAYISCMNDEGLRKATQVALLNANYILNRLKGHYPILYTNEKGRCAHEFIIDARPFKESSGIEAIDIAKRLQDYGFHAPTMSWPVPNTLMIEPTESESKAELDRFIDAMISIRQEIRAIEQGEQPREGNVLKNSPHTQVDIISGDGQGSWQRPYSRDTAAFPLPYLKEKKFWPTVTRVDDAYGDVNFMCSCPPIKDAMDSLAVEDTTTNSAQEKKE